MPSVREIEEVEAILGRLMPVEMSQEGFEQIESWMDDEMEGILVGGLVGEEVDERGERVLAVSEWAWWSGWRKWAMGVGAAIVAMVIGWMGGAGESVRSSSQVAKANGVEKDGNDLVLVSAVHQIEDLQDEGIYEDPDGLAMRAMRLNVLEINTVKDVVSGLVMHIEEPREEVVSMPVTRF